MNYVHGNPRGNLSVSYRSTNDVQSWETLIGGVVFGEQAIGIISEAIGEKKNEIAELEAKLDKAQAEGVIQRYAIWPAYGGFEFSYGIQPNGSNSFISRGGPDRLSALKSALEYVESIRKTALKDVLLMSVGDCCYELEGRGLIASIGDFPPLPVYRSHAGFFARMFPAETYLDFVRRCVSEIRAWDKT